MDGISRNAGARSYATVESVVMDFDEFEQLVLKVLFETDVPVTAAHVAYLGRVSVRTADRKSTRLNSSH